jgi:thioredoxin-dependent peroxiredoxin
MSATSKKSKGVTPMSLRIGDTAPDFEAETTQGKIRFHEWLGDSWGILFSHPKDFTPVCTTELGYMAKLQPDFQKRNVKVIGLSVDPVDRHQGWAKDIEETQGFAPNFPMIGDPTLAVSKLYDMLPAAAGDSSEGRTAADNQTVRTVYVIGPDKKIKLSISYPMTTGLRRDPARSRFDAVDGEAQGSDAGELEARRRRDHCRLGHQRRREEDLAGRLEGTQALHPHRPAARRLGHVPFRIGAM